MEILQNRERQGWAMGIKGRDCSKGTTPVPPVPSEPVSEPACLTCTLRCERMIQGRKHTERDIESAWLKGIDRKIIRKESSKNRHTKNDTTQNGAKTTPKPIAKGSLV
jgi:hypothetical protein